MAFQDFFTLVFLVILVCSPKCNNFLSNEVPGFANSHWKKENRNENKGNLTWKEWLPSLSGLSTSCPTFVWIKFAPVVAIWSTIVIYRTCSRPVSSNGFSIQPNLAFTHRLHVECNWFISSRRIHYHLEQFKRRSVCKQIIKWNSDQTKWRQKYAKNNLVL